MIKFTNKYGISDAIVNAVKIDNHVTIGDISVTQLIDSPQIRILKKTHDIEEDVSDRIWMLFGTAVHYVVEMGEITSREARQLLEAAEVLVKYEQTKAAEWMYEFINKTFPEHKNKDILTEVTLSHTINGMMFSGTFDRFTISTGLLDDYKTTGVYAYMNAEARKKWDAQLNVYAFLLRENGYEVNAAQITAIFKDFSPSKLFSSGYPKKPIATFPVKLYEHKLIKEFLTRRVKLHKDAQMGNVAECTSKEMWQTSDTFAVTTPTRTRAIKVFPTEALAKAFMLGDGAKYGDKAYVEKRPGERKRCDQYCSVSKVCPQNIKRLELENKK